MIPYALAEPVEIDEWTAVAIQPRPGAPCASRRRGVASVHGPRWRDIPEAPLTLAQAKALVEAGLLLAANRVTDCGTEFVVKTARLALSGHGGRR
jgi:hypothetical protein